MTDYYDSHDAAPDHDAGRSDTEHGMTRRQLIRHAGWFGGAVVLTVAGGEVISHIADARDTNADAQGTSASANAGASAAAAEAARCGSCRSPTAISGSRVLRTWTWPDRSPKRSTRSTRLASGPTSSCTVAI